MQKEDTDKSQEQVALGNRIANKFNEYTKKHGLKEKKGEFHNDQEVLRAVIRISSTQQHNPQHVKYKNGPE